MPLSLVVRARTVWFRSSDVTVTFAFGTTEPDASVTVPRMFAVTSCALRGGGILTATKAKQANTTTRRWSMEFPFGVSVAELSAGKSLCPNPRTHVRGYNPVPLGGDSGVTA